MDSYHKKYRTGELPMIGDLVFNPAHQCYGVCVALFGQKGWARILWTRRPFPIVRPIFNIKLIKRGSYE